jgi:outer membrane protein OmpA-like peptidoglycan-associated protein
MRSLLIFVPFVFVNSLTAQVSNNTFKLVNSLYDEQNPVISPDGSTLFFTVGNHPKNIGGKKDPGDIWFSRWLGDQWTAPIHGGSLLNDRAYNAVAGISTNGNQLFLQGHYDPSGSVAKTQGISISSSTGQGWSRPANISIPYYQNKSAMLCGAVSEDGSVFVFSAETYGTHGVDDIYVSLNEGGRWSAPKNLGATINTQFQELSPSISRDGKTLYFSSNGLKGSGSFDVFSATRLDNSWTSWSTPINMGTNINSEGRELYFRIHPELGFATFTSTINSDGYGDVKLYRRDDLFVKKDSIITAAPPLDTVVRITEVKHDTAVDNTLVNVYGKVMNAKTGETVNANVTFAAAGIRQNTTSASDGYTIAVSSTKQYSISIEARGFVSSMEKLDINTYEMKALEMNFTLQPVEVGTTVNLKNVLFAQTKTDILPESYPELDLVVSFLNSNPNVRIELTGHTDNRGIHGDNVKLSQQRVNRVKDYLVAKGIDARRISGKGYGGTKPIASNDTEESRKMNRRVEFTIKRF